MAAHFVHEEELMADFSYPLLARHKEAHALFLGDARSFQAELMENGVSPGFRRWAAGRLPEWFRYHILAHDMGLGQFLNKAGVAAWRGAPPVLPRSETPGADRAMTSYADGAGAAGSGRAAGAALPEERERARVAVQVGGPAHRTDLAVAEEAAQRGRPELLLEEGGVVVGPAEEAGSPAGAGEEQRAGRGFAPGAPSPLQHALQILLGGVSVAEHELHRLHRVEHLAHGEGAALLVGPHDVPHQELPGVVLDPLLSHVEAQEQGVAHQVSVAGAERLVDLAQDPERRAAVELLQEAALAPGDQHGRSDGAAALGDDGLDLDVAGEGQRDRAAAVDLGAEQQAVVAR